MRSLVSILAALALAVAAVGCGSDDGTTLTEPPAADPGTITLELQLNHVEVDGDGSAGIDCGADGSNSVACELAAAIDPAVFEPPDPNVACTEIYGGPDELFVAGEINGEVINAIYTRANGCEIDRFDAWVPLLQELYPGYVPGASIDH